MYMRHKCIIFILLLVFIFPVSLYAQERAKKKMSIEERIEYLQKEIDELKRLLKKQREEKRREQEIKRREIISVEAPQIISPKNVKVSLGGQYRINFYSARNESNNILKDHDDQRAARVRIRQNIDLKFNNGLSTHLQLELQHTTDNVTTTDMRLGNKKTDVSVRHAVIRYCSQNGTIIEAGIIPLHDFFHDAMFSSDWDYNPVAANFVIPIGKNGKLRLFAADLKEGEENISQDDFIHYQADYLFKIGKADLTITGTALNLQEDPSYGRSDAWHYNFGVGYSFPFRSIKINGFFMGSYTEKELIGTNDDASGIAMLLELKRKIGRGDFGFLFSYATGNDEGEGFLPPMAFSKTFGYWGYTGILTVQGPTDTGFDFDAVNISNNGLGLTTFQARYVFPVMDKLSLYTAAGWFGNTDAPDERKSTLGIDLFGMGIYKFNRYLELDLGLAYAHMRDSVSGYFQGVQHGGRILFNQDIGEKRDKIVTFGRLQAEF